LYFYDVKIQTNIKQNLVKKYAGKSHFLKIFFWTGLDPAHSFWIGPENSGALSTVHLQREQWGATGEEVREGN